MISSWKGIDQVFNLKWQHCPWTPVYKRLGPSDFFIIMLKQENFRRVQIERFADDKINVTEKLKFVNGKNTVGKVENAGYQHFLLCPQ